MDRKSTTLTLPPSLSAFIKISINCIILFQTERNEEKTPKTENEVLIFGHTHRLNIIMTEAQVLFREKKIHKICPLVLVLQKIKIKKTQSVWDELK